MHHVDVHVSDLAAARRLYDALMPMLGYELRSKSEDFFSYWRDRRRPSIGFLEGDARSSGSTRLAFSVGSIDRVEQVASVVRAHDARHVDGPALHPEYGPDYYAVFFEDADGNKFEVVCEPEQA